MHEGGGSNSPRDAAAVTEVFERITDAVYALDRDWQFTYLDEDAEAVFDRDRGELLGAVVWDAVPELAESTFRAEHERALETGDPVAFEEYSPPLDARLDVRIYPSETGLSVVFRDVGERAHRQETLRDRERALRRAYEVIADRDRSFSEQIDALLNVVREAVGTDYATLSRVEGDEYVFEAVDAPEGADLRAGDSVSLSSTNCERVVETERTLVLDDVESDAPELADKSGNADWGISCYLGAPVSVDGEMYGTFCFYGMEARSREFSNWDVAFVDLLSNWVSNELERQRQNERLDSFASMVAHELRNPLHIAQLYHRPAAEGDGAAAEEVATALERIEEIIDVILVTARSRDSAVDREPVDLADAAADAWADTATAEADLVVEAGRTVDADPIHLHHLLLNLFKNAVEHGGRDVTISVGEIPDGFYVEDDGSGIPAEKRCRVFGAGFTTDADGIGLGLTFVARLAETYDWQCSVTQNDAGGARFEFTGVELADENAAESD